MDLYFAGAQTLEVDQHIVNKNGNRLFSYVDLPKNRLELFTNSNCKVFMDSGAFGVAHSNKQVTLDNYIDFINNNPKVTLFAALDVIPKEKTTLMSKESAKKSWENYCYMIRNVKPEFREKIIPSYHFSEPIEFVENMLKGVDGFIPPYIAYGGRVGTPTKHLYNSLDNFFDVIERVKPDTKVHGFGITVLEILEKYPFTSADSTSWLKTAVNGSIFSDKLNKSIKISAKTFKDPLHYSCLHPHLQEILLNEIKEYNFNLEALQNDVKERLKYNIDYFYRWTQNYKYTPRPKIRKGSLIKNAKN